MRWEHAHRVCAAALLLWLAAAATRAEAYGVRLRWLHDAQDDVAGYRVHVWPDEAPADPPIDVGLPPEAEDGTLGAIVTGLAPRVDYSIAVSAVFSNGTETALSNALRVVYAEVAPLIDSDGDGVRDADDDCPDTPPGAVTGPGGCTCDQLACDDGDPCNGVERCVEGTCMPASPDTLPPSDLTDQRVTLRVGRHGRAWKFDAVATTSADPASSLQPQNASVEIWGTDSEMPFRAAVAADRFVPRSRRIRFVTPVEGATGGLRRLEIADHDGERTVRVSAWLPPAALPSGPAEPVAWVVRLGDTCARDLHLVCTPAGGRFVCR